jgi:hypothetical protein
MATLRNFPLVFGVVAVIREPVKLILEAVHNCICMLYTKHRKLIITCIVKIRHTGITSANVKNTKSQLYIGVAWWRFWLRLCATSHKQFRFSMVSLEFFTDIILPGSQCVVLTTIPPSCTDCLVVWEPQPLGTLRTFPGLYRDFFTFVCSKFIIRIIWIIINNNSVINLLNGKPIQ